MRIFNLAEELEKERKKNKDLQVNIDDLVNSNCQLNEYIEQLEKEIEKLTAESTEWEERTYCWQDRAEDLQIIIDKAIEYIEDNTYYKSHKGSICADDVIMILKGSDNNE